MARAGSASYTVGVLVQANFGRRSQLMVAGVPVGREIPQPAAQAGHGLVDDPVRGDLGSIIIVVGTDAPLLPHQLKRLARRATLGMARTGGLSGNGSGDIFIAFSTANPDAFKGEGLASLQMVSNEEISPIFDATAWATEEAIINAMVAADDDGWRRWPACRAPAPRSPARGAEEVQPPRAVGDRRRVGRLFRAASEDCVTTSGRRS